MSLRRFSLFAVMIVLVSAVPLAAQAPHEEWRTITTPHFRIHYPLQYEAWSRRVAEKIESIRSAVTAEVGFEPKDVVDVVVMNPVAQANGSAWPFLGWPRMILWATPPESSSVIGNYTDWPELLVLHEDTHLVHLLRPSRSPMKNFLARISGLPLGPITGAPRWVSEGYATVLEGELTGRGRPNSDIRAAILRAWAQAGRLPSYGQMASDSSSWLGMSMAYLMGSAYLEWLRERAGEESLRNLWARLSARRERSFDEAFIGVFGEKPEELYRRFTAELTRDAMAAEERQRTALREGELWQELSWTTDAPALSPDEKLLATVVRSRREPPRLVVYSTEPPTEEEKKYNERIEKMLKRDPQDIAPVRVKPLARKPKHTLQSRSGANPIGPRWSSDGTRIYFVQFEPDSEGFLHPDLFEWTVAGGNVRRVTHDADVRDVDPAPDGSWAIAVRHRHGVSQLVRISLPDGTVTEVTPASVETVYDDPRVSRDGASIAYGRNSGSGWELVARRLSDGSETIVTLPSNATMVAAPVWSRSGDRIIATVGSLGSIDLWSLDPANSVAPHRITRTTSAAANAAPGTNEIYFLGLTPDGYEIRRIGIDALQTPIASLVEESTSVAVPKRVARREFARTPVGPSTAYAARPETSVLWGGVTSTVASSFEGGIRLGDVVGRYDALILGAAGDDEAVSGFAAAATWRGWPIEVGAHLFNAERGEDLTDRGAELSAMLRRQARARVLDARLALVVNQQELADVDSDTQSVVAGISHSARPGVGSLFFPNSLTLLGESGSGDDVDWTAFRGSVSAGVAYKRNVFEASYEQGSGSDEAEFSLGGVESSILPWSSSVRRIVHPALNESTLVSSDYQKLGAEVTTPLLPLTLFYDAYTFEDGPTDVDLNLAGLRLDFSLASMPVVRLPAATLSLGGARILEGPDEDENRYWLSLTWRP